MRTELYWIEGPWPGRLAIMPRPRGGDWLEDEISSWRRLGLSGATWKDRADYNAGRVKPGPCYVRGARVLPIGGAFESVVNLLQKSTDLAAIIEMLQQGINAGSPDPHRRQMTLVKVIEALDAMINDGWVTPSYNPERPLFKVTFHNQSIKLNEDVIAVSGLESRVSG